MAIDFNLDEKKRARNFVFGIGKDSIRFFNWLMEIGVPVIAYVTSDENRKESHNGIPVLSISELDNTDRIFISARERKSAFEIKQMLKQKGHHEDCIIDLSKLYQNNLIVDPIEMRKHDSLENSERYCNICKTTVSRFIPKGIDEDLFRMHHIIGGGRRDNVECPCCGSNDRERWLKHVIETKTNILTEKTQYFILRRNDILKECFEIMFL